jgi:hypothetical protein
MQQIKDYKRKVELDNRILRAEIALADYINSPVTDQEDLEQYRQTEKIAITNFINEIRQIDPHNLKAMELHNGYIFAQNERYASCIICRADQLIMKYKALNRNIKFYYKIIMKDYIEKALQIDPQNESAFILKKNIVHERDEYEKNRCDKLGEFIVYALLFLFFLYLFYCVCSV